MTTTAYRDEAKLLYLSGDGDVLAGAARVWEESGNLLEAQRALEAATRDYSRAIADSGIPAAHAERLGAALIARLNRAGRLARSEDTGHDVVGA